MSKDELIKIVIAAAVAVGFKELFSWLIRTSKPVAITLTKIIGKWMFSMAFLIEFAVDVGLFILWVALFLFFPDSGSPVTHSTVRWQIFLVLIAFAQLSSARLSFLRYRKHRPNTALEPTPTAP